MPTIQNKNKWSQNDKKLTLIRKRINDGFIRRKGRDQGGGEGLTVIVVR